MKIHHVVILTELVYIIKQRVQYILVELFRVNDGYRDRVDFP